MRSPEEWADELERRKRTGEATTRTTMREAMAEARREALKDFLALADELRIGPYVKVDPLRLRIEDSLDAEVKP